MPSTDYNQLAGPDSNDMRACVFPDLIQRLCPDILAEIFIFCLPDKPKEPWRVESMSSRNAPLILCSVCSSWRSLAISTPRLWQTLHFRASSEEGLTIDIESITSGIRIWLDRSGALPLSIRAIFWIRDPESDEATKCRQIFEVLSQEIPRWEIFELQEDGIWVTPPHFGIFPVLHTLDISGSTLDEIPFTSAPRLKRLSSYYSPCPNSTSVSAIPWNQLVELTIGERQPVSMVAQVLLRCPQLESLYLLVDEGVEDSSPTFRSITQHDALKRLGLHMVPYVNAAMDHLTLPALTDLSMEALCLSPEVEAKIRCSQLLAFFTRSNCKLREFVLYYSGFGPGELLECLSHRSCQTLTRLAIQGDDSSPPVINRELLIRLTYPDVDDDIPLCPKLGHLELNDCYCSDRLFPDLLGRMIQSRCFGRAQDAQLRSLWIWNRYSVSKEDYELLQFAQSNGGLELKYSYITSRATNNLNVIPDGGTDEEVDEEDLEITEEKDPNFSYLTPPPY